MSVLEPATLLHDIARDFEFRMRDAGFKVCHAEKGAEMAQDYLNSINYDKTKIEPICYVIRNHRFSKRKDTDRIEAVILQECDRLDATGSIGIMRTLLHNKDKQAYHPEKPLPANPRDLNQNYGREINDYDYGVDHFFFKILKIKDTITLPELKIVAEQRQEVMVDFLENLEYEVLNKKEGPALKIIHIIRNNDLPVYDINEPFKPGDDTLVGKIMKYYSTPFIKEFIDELKTEIL